MSWQREWQSIDALITEFAEISDQFVAALRVNSLDSLGTIKNVIIPMVQDIDKRIFSFRERYKSQMPGTALQQINDFTGELNFESEDLPTTMKNATTVSHFSARLRRFRADFNYLTSDLEGVAVRRTTRALIHLQRSIVADPKFQENWIAALGRGERACEKLGAIHLLLHGIWSFKAKSAGERTDLILGEPLGDDDLSDIYLSADGLVLTEWKVAGESNATEKFEEAFKQAELYGSGSLAAIELKSYRYLIVVSSDAIHVPKNRESDGIVYVHFNIAVDPSSPSVLARKKRDVDPET